MTATLRSDSSVAYGGRTNTTIPAPTGIQNGDQLRIVFLIGAAPGIVPAATPPAGFTEKGSPYPLIVIGDGPFELQARVYEKPASGEAGDYTITHANASTAAWMGAVQGAANQGSAATGATDAGTAPVAPGVTPDDDGALIIFWASSFNFLGAVTPPGSPPVFTERLDSGASILYAATGEMAVAGPTGNKTVTVTQGPSMAGLIVVEAAADLSPKLSRRRIMVLPATTAIGITLSQITNSPFKSDIFPIHDASRLTLEVQADQPASAGSWVIKAVPAPDNTIDGQIVVTTGFPATPADVSSVTAEVAHMWGYVQQVTPIAGATLQRVIVYKQ